MNERTTIVFARASLAALFLPASVVLAAALWLGGCADTATCDVGFELRNDLCLPATKARDAGADAQAAPSCEDDTSNTGEFGADCRSNADCACPAPVCAIQPGEAKGFCTQVGCDSNPERCPADWVCFDLSVIDPSYPQTCLPPG